MDFPNVVTRNSTEGGRNKYQLGILDAHPSMWAANGQPRSLVVNVQESRATDSSAFLGLVHERTVSASHPSNEQATRSASLRVSSMSMSTRVLERSRLVISVRPGIGMSD